jgi:hypothetical protein
VSGGPRVAPAGGEQSRAESLTLVGRCGGITQPVGPRSLRCSAASPSSAASQGISTSLEGQPRVECRKTCGRGVKRTQILGMGYSTPRPTQWKEFSACRINGRYFYHTLCGHHRYAHRLSNPREHPAGRRTSRTIWCDRAEGRKAREQSHVKHTDNIVIPRTPVFSIGAAVHDAMAKAHALYFLQHSVSRALYKP